MHKKCKGEATMRNKKLIWMAGIIILLGIVIIVFLYTRNNYSGTDIDRYVGRWEMTELWQNGEQVGCGFGDTFLEIKADGAVKYKDPHESYESKLKRAGDELAFTRDDGYRYTLSIKKGYLLLHAENTKDEKDPGGQFIYKKVV